MTDDHPSTARQIMNNLTCDCNSSGDDPHVWCCCFGCGPREVKCCVLLPDFLFRWLSGYTGYNPQDNYCGCCGWHYESNNPVCDSPNGWGVFVNTITYRSR